MMTHRQTQNLTTLLQEAVTLHQQGQLTQARVLYEQILAKQPEHFDALHLLGVVAGQSQQAELAVTLLSQAIAVKPNHASAYSNLGMALHELKRYQNALINYDKAIAIQPNNADFHYNRGNALRQLQHNEEAIANYDTAIAIQPNFAKAHHNRGIALYELKRHEEALESYNKAVTLKPDYADARFNRSLVLLLQGHFEKGWQEYEWRLQREDVLKLGLRSFSSPLWLGTENLAGKTILLHAEQGLGDTLQFCRYAQLVKALGATVLLDVPSSLMGLLAGLPGVDVLIESGQALPAFDYHCPLMSLPLAFKTDLTSIPHPTAYLHSNASKLEAWRQRLGTKTNPRIGLVWSGSTEHKNDHNRSLPLAELLQHLPDTFEYVSLQKEVRQSDQAALTTSKLLHFGDELKDFTDTAALCDCVDVVVSVDTSVAHLAGAMGKPTCVLLPYVPDWRWLLDKEDCAWYTSVKLYRQGEDRQWTAVLSQVIADLSQVHLN